MSHTFLCAGAISSFWLKFAHSDELVCKGGNVDWNSKVVLDVDGFRPLNDGDSDCTSGAKPVVTDITIA